MAREIKLCNRLGMILFLMVSLFFITRSAFTQSEKLLKLPAHTDAATMPWWDSVYLFPDFQYSRIVYMTGFSPADLFMSNYNLYFGTVDFINGKGDTLQVTPTRELRLINMGGHVFYHDVHKGYIEILVQAPIALGVRTILYAEKSYHDADYVAFQGSSTGSYSRSSGFSGTGGSDGGTNYPENGIVDVRGRPTSYDRYYKEKADYYFIDKKNEPHPASKYSIRKLFSNYKQNIDVYLLENNIHFDNAHDLTELLNFCGQIEQLQQDDESNSFRVQAGQDIAKLFWYDSIYRFSSFDKGSIMLNNGDTLDKQLILNYNFYSGEMDRISIDGDTLKIENASDIATLTIGNCNFYRDYYQGYVEIVRILTFKKVENSADNSTETTAPKITTSTRYYRGSSHNTVVDYDRLFRKEERYFFIDQNRGLYPANKLWVMRLFPNNKRTINNYIAENKVDFTKEKNLTLLMNFCNQLPIGQ